MLDAPFLRSGKLPGVKVMAASMAGMVVGYAHPRLARSNSPPMKIRKLSLILSAVLGLGLIGPAVASAQLGSNSDTSADVATDTSVRSDDDNSNDDDGLLGLGILGDDNSDDSDNGLLGDLLGGNSDDSNDDGLLGDLLGGDSNDDSDSGLLGGESDDDDLLGDLLGGNDSNDSNSGLLGGL